LGSDTRTSWWGCGSRWTAWARGWAYGLGVQLGPRFRLGDAVRLELLADVGVESYSVDYDADLLLVSGKTSGSSLASYGGTMVGAYLTFTSLRPLGT
jgi:hypothetical protein